MKLRKSSIYKLFFGMILYPVYLISSLIPRSKDIWVFGAWYGNQYNDNTSYLFEYVVKKRSDIKAVWLTKNNKIIHDMREKGHSVFHANSIKGIWYGSRAGVTFINCGYDDVNKYCINRSFKVQFWHGVPLKKIKSDDRINENIKRSYIIILIRDLLLKLFPFLNEKYDLIISSGMKVTDRFETAFNINRNKIVETGYPRMDIITSHEFSYTKDMLYNEELIKNCILYAPTHRKEGSGNNSYFTFLNFENFNQFLKDNDAILLIKMHYYEQVKMEMFKNQYSNIKLLNNHDLSDINKILYHVDLLITDYSSVFYDYLVLDRPILFSSFDLMEYQKIDREFYEDYQSSTPGIKCYDWDEIQFQLKKYFLKEDSCQVKRKKIFKQYYRFSDNQNCLRVTNTVANYL